MDFFKYFRGFIEDGLNERLDAKERATRPFRIYADVGDADFDKRDINDVIGKKYGILSMISSNISPLSTLKFAEINTQCEIVINVDGMEISEDEPGYSEYKPVSETRSIISDFISEYHGKSFYIKDDDNTTNYSVTPTFDFSTVSSAALTTSNFGKIVPMRFTASCIFVQNGVNADSVRYSIKYNNKTFELYTIEATESMTSSTEGQTHNGEAKSVSTVQESKYAVELVTPLTNNEFCIKLLDILNNGTDNTIYELSVSYDLDGTNNPIVYSHNVIISNVVLTAQRPENVGVNISFIDGDDFN